MYWKNKVFVFDDVVPLEQQEAIKARCLGLIPWYFVNDVTSSEKQEQQNARPGFSHSLVMNGKQVTSDKNAEFLNELLRGVFKKLYEVSNEKGKYALIQSRAFLQLPLATLCGAEYDNHHIDTFQRHLAVLYYVCDADGETVIFENMYKPDQEPSEIDLANKRPKLKELKEKQRVMPKQGRVVIFDGYHWHTATQPKKGLRCVINTNIDQYG